MIIKEGDPQCFSVIVRTLRKGNPIILLCDTMYGLVGTAPDTEEKLCAIKGRAKGKPFLELIPDIRWTKIYSDIIIPPSLARLWPGPLTIILPRRDSGTVGLRVPGGIFLRRIIEGCGKPLFSTSVNREGEAPLTDIDRIIDVFHDDVELIVDSGNAEKNIPSTILDISRKPFRIVRQGVMTIAPDVLRDE
ncbi:MAG: L-threonylcarbamoyladenylate synthase [Spirochaetales bacterium]|nr:L-threonylcarbamoyladenylate synthase [Spirochaetales bacterium]